MQHASDLIVLRSGPGGILKTRSGPATLRTQIEVKEGLRRTRSENIVIRVPGQAARRNLFAEVCVRLNLKHIELSRYTFDRLEHLIPQCGRQDQLDIFFKFASDPMSVSGAELSTIFDLEESTANGPITAADSDHYYVREFETSCGVFREFCEHMIRQGFIFEECQLWLSNLDGRRFDDTVCIRYIGHCRGERYPFLRHLEDIQIRTSGILGNFMNQVQAYFPEIWESLRVWRFGAASHQSTGEFSSDDVERFLIAMFNQATLLNRQAGGFYISYVPSAADNACFVQLQTNLNNTFAAQCRPASRELRAAIDAHFKALQLWANDNPLLTGTGDHEFTDKLRDVMIRQATPRQINGRTIVVFLGEWITIDDYTNAASFFDGGSRSENLVRDMLKRHCRLETERNGEEWYEYGFEPEYWCFIDWFCVLWRKSRKDASERLRGFFRIVRPLIATSFSLPVNNVTMGNFLHENGVPGRAFYHQVGVPSIRHYDRNTASPVVETDEDAFINIPHYHPGFDKYGAQDISLRRVYDLTFQINAKICDMMTAKVIADIDGTMKSGALCLSVMADWEAFKQTPAGDTLIQSLTQAKSAMFPRFLNSMGTQSGSSIQAGPRNQAGPSIQAGLRYRPLELEDPKELLAFPTWIEQGVEMFQSCGVSHGKPGSTTRIKQLRGLWAANLPDMHLVMPHTPASQAQWMQLLSGVPEDEHLLLHAMSASDDGPYLEDLLGRYKPLTATSSDWLQNADAKAYALTEADKELRRRLVLIRLEPEKPVTFRGEAAVPTDEMDGLVVAFDNRGRFRVRWLRAGKSEVHFRLPCRAGMPTFEEQIRRMRFTVHGIDIEDENDNAIRPQDSRTGSAFRATVPYRAFASLGDDVGPKVTELWKAVCEFLGLDINATIGTSDNARPFPTTKGLKLVPANAVTETPLQNKPPALADATYPLMLFIDERFPDGGTWDTGKIETFPASTDDTTAFITYLRGSGLRGHPYSDTWLSMLDKPKPDHGLLGKNIAPYRSVHVRSVVEHIPGTGTKARHNMYEIGPPGTQGYTGGRPKKSGVDLDLNVDSTLPSDPRPKAKLKRSSGTKLPKSGSIPAQPSSSKQTTLDFKTAAGTSSSQPAQQKKGKKRDREGDDPEEGGDGSRKIAKTKP